MAWDARMNFILFNGPPRSGKDTAAKIALDYVHKTHGAYWEKFSYPLKRGFAGIVDHSIDDEGNVDTFEKIKEDIIPFLGVSYRQFQIDMSEKFMKPLYGNNIFGRLLLQRCHEIASMSSYPPVFIVSDCGFQIECDVLKDHNILFFNMIRPNTSYTGDSREEVVPNINWTRYRILNDGPVNHLQTVIESRVKEWLK
jgi:hypothetical protein